MNASNDIPTVSIYYLAKPQPRERAWQNQRGKQKRTASRTGVKSHLTLCRGKTTRSQRHTGSKWDTRLNSKQVMATSFSSSEASKDDEVSFSCGTWLD
ncbi:hypothetical protein LZ32DRAFT_357120 [Colletotrichum eremochloae]|nr:hypothetical protein LZ32DRAFT_357120 [Colletotrichum eremochloae]